MQFDLIDEARAIAWLKTAVDLAGGVRAYAAKQGVSAAHISQMLHGKTAISGRVASSLGLEKVNAYRLNTVVPSPKQEQYEKERAAWREQNPIITADELRAMERKKE